MKKDNRRSNSGLARVALGATAALALAGGAHAVTCTTSQYVSVNAATGTGSCASCPTGTVAGATSETGAAGAGVATYCNHIAANYWGTAGAQSSKHAVVTACPAGLARATTSTATVGREQCSNSFAVGTYTAIFTTPNDAANGLLAGGTGITNVNYLRITAASNIGTAASNLLSLTVHACPEGTTTSYPFTASLNPATALAETYCNTMETEYYGVVGAANTGTGAAHAVVTKCPFAGTTGITTTNSDIQDCTTTCAAAASFAVASNSCVCAANYYGSPKDANGLTLGTATTGCTACPASTSTVTKTNVKTLDGCLVNAGFYISAASATTGGAGTLSQAPQTHYAKGGIVAVTSTAAVLTTVAANTDYASAGLTACPTGFATAAVGKSLRQECFKVFTNPASSGTDAYSIGSASVAGAATLYACPEGTSGTAFTVAAATGANAATFCHSTIANYYGTQGSIKRHASSVSACPTNSASAALSTDLSDCKCNGGYSSGSNSCIVCSAGTYKAAGDIVGIEANCVGCGTGFTSIAGASSCTAVPAPSPATTTATNAATTSGATGASMLAAISAVAAVQLVL